MENVLITPSYAPDFERCKLLCESVEDYVASYSKHIIIVDERDYALFRQLKGPNNEVITKESMLPKWLKKIPFSKKWWFSFKTLPVRGWILQQIIKLLVAECIEGEVYLFADSDVVFVRPFDIKDIVKNGQVRLSRLPLKEVDRQDKRRQNWHHQAEKLFALPSQLNKLFESDYISQLNCWRRDTLLKMTDLIEQTSGRGWKETLCNTIDFSEYTLYGIFAEFILKDESGHYWDEKELCHCSWHFSVDKAQELDGFLAQIQPYQVAILIQSNLGMDPEQYKGFIKKLQNRIQQQ